MTITFYLGKDYKDIRKKFDRIKKHYAKHLNEGYSNSDCFRYIVNLLYEAIIDLKRKNEVNKNNIKKNKNGDMKK